LYGGALSSTLHTEKSTALSILNFFEHGAAVEFEEEDGDEEDGEVEEGEEEEEEEEVFEGEEYKVEEEEDTVEEDVDGVEEDALLGTEGGSES
jgi:hypothetical protein